MANGHLAHNLRMNRLNSVFSAVSNNMLQPFVNRVAIEYGATNPQLGALSSLAQFFSLAAMLPGAVWLKRASAKGKVLAWMFLVSKLFIVGIAATTLVPPRGRVWALIFMWALFNLPLASANTGVSTLIADVMPGDVRGRAFAERNSVASLAGTVIVLAAGWLLDRLPQPQGYLWMFTAAGVIGLAEIYYLLQMREDAGTGPAVAGAAAAAAPRQPWHQTARQLGRQIAAEGPFVRFLLASLTFHFTWQLAWPMFNRYQVTNMGADNLWTSLISVATSVGSALSYQWWARQSELKGNLNLLRWAALGMAITPFITIAAPNLLILTVFNIGVGVSVAGITLLILNSLLDVVPAGERTLFLTVHQAVITLSAAVAPLVGGYLMDLLPIVPALFLAGCLRLLSTFVIYLHHRNTIRRDPARTVA